MHDFLLSSYLCEPSTFCLMVNSTMFWNIFFIYPAHPLFKHFLSAGDKSICLDLSSFFPQRSFITRYLSEISEWLPPYYVKQYKKNFNLQLEWIGYNKCHRCQSAHCINIKILSWEKCHMSYWWQHAFCVYESVSCLMAFHLIGERFWCIVSTSCEIWLSFILLYGPCYKMFLIPKSAVCQNAKWHKQKS